MPGVNADLCNSLSAQWNFEVHLDRSTCQWRQIEELRLLRMNYLQQHDVGGIGNLEIKEMKLCNVRGVNPQVVLIANPVAERFAFHWFGANLERHFGQQMPGHFKVLKRVLPALFVRPLGRSAFARQASFLFQSNILAHPLFPFGFRRIVAFSEPLQKVVDVPTAGKNLSDEFEISDGCRIDIEDRNSFGFPQRNQIQTIKPTDHANHVDVVTPFGRDGLVMSDKVGKLSKRSVLASVIRPIKNHFRMIVINRPIKSSWSL